MNKVMIIGNVTRDPELKKTQNGTSVCTFGIAVSRKLTAKQKQASAQGADFFNVVAWRGTAEACAKYLSKGKKAAVLGRMQTFRSAERSEERMYRSSQIGGTAADGKRSFNDERSEERCDRSSQQGNKRSFNDERSEERCDRSSQQGNKQSPSDERFKRYITEIVAEEVEFLSPREDSGFAPYSQAEIEPVGSDEPLPF